jgi:hypothetical protein
MYKRPSLPRTPTPRSNITLYIQGGLDESSSLERWKSLLESVRNVYSGPLTVLGFEEVAMTQRSFWKIVSDTMLALRVRAVDC